ncbi:MAG: M48 family metallopeptidase [Candidatus Micrarchaeota archaeon]|nr:M48 family metallopeptidase [Candidatus Micrarchaeota archaeon]
MGTIRTELGEISYSVVRGKRRSISLHFQNSSTLVVSVPKYSLVNIERLLDRHMKWITKQFCQMLNSKDMVREEEVLYNGSYHKIEFVPWAGRAKVTRLENEILVESQDRMSGLRALDRFMQKSTAQIAEEMIAPKLRQTEKSISSLRFRRMRKWGYCNTDGMIKLNAYLSMLPIEIFDYVVSHEVAHLSHMNHSKRFWAVVSQLCPNYRELRKELKRYNTNGLRSLEQRV